MSRVMLMVALERMVLAVPERMTRAVALVRMIRYLVIVMVVLGTRIRVAA